MNKTHFVFIVFGESCTWVDSHSSLIQSALILAVSTTHNKKGFVALSLKIPYCATVFNSETPLRSSVRPAFS